MEKLNINQLIRKIGLSFFALFLTITFAACSNQNSNTNKDNNTQAEETDNNKDQKEDSEKTEESTNKDSEDKKNSDKQTSDKTYHKENLDCYGNEKREIFVTADDVKEVIDGKEELDNYIIAEVTWGESDASQDYLKNHIPGAIHINTDSIEEGPVWNFKSDDDIVKSMLDNGIDKDTTVFLYGPDSGAPRVALAYLIEGADNVKLIDGGIKAWMDKGYETEKEENKAEAKNDFKAEYPAHPEMIVSLDEAKKDIEDENSDVQYISTRAYEEYIGETSGYTYIPKAGELPSAIYGHDEADYKNENGTYISYTYMLDMLKKEGVDPSKEMVFYCGTGWRAALPVLKFYEKGIDAKLFDGGWNEWQMHDELPVQVGDPKDNAEMTTVGNLSNDKASKE